MIGSKKRNKARTASAAADKRGGKVKKVLWMAGVAILVIIIGLVACDLAVSINAKGRMYDDVGEVPHRKVGLVLGTSPVSTWTGQRNLHFDRRIQAAADLYNSGKVEWLIVSGGDYRNSEENGFDEPVAMRDSLVKQRVDSARIILDYDGTRTLNSIAKVRDIYRQDSIVIISQEFHNARALYQAKHLGLDAIAYNAETPVGMRSAIWWRNRGREVFARVKLFMDVARNLQPDIKESLAWDFTKPSVDLLTVENVGTEFGDLVCLKPDMSNLKMDLVCGTIPDANNDSIVLAFAGAFTGELLKEFKHSNIAGDHVSGGVRHKGYRCARNTGAFTWSNERGPQFTYKDYSASLDNCTMGFAQEMMIHRGKTVKTTRPLGNVNVFRALCQDSKGNLVLYETQGTMTFGNFIEALLAQGVTEALYTDMGQGWNYCFYRQNTDDSSPSYLHNRPLPYASNFVVLKKR